MINYRGLKIAPVSFGNVHSDNLFDPKEQGIFNFYEAHKDRYKRAADIGANIGVHSILMLKLGWEVKSYEPDPKHFAELVKNLRENEVTPEVASQVAVSDHDGRMPFVRVMGNTTGSHLRGDKIPYGDLEEFEVDVVDCRPIFRWADFAKLDCEGHEAKLLLTVDTFSKCEFMVEVGNAENACKIFYHFKGFKKMWAQQTDWGEVSKISQMPYHHSHGALFIGEKP